MPNKLWRLPGVVSSSLLFSAACTVGTYAASPQTADKGAKNLPFIIGAVAVAIAVMAIILKRSGRPHDED